MVYCLRATCCQHECKEMYKRKHQSAYGKLACQVYQTRNANFACKTRDQALWKHV
jgi:hypothetical protein